MYSEDPRRLSKDVALSEERVLAPVSGVEAESHSQVLREVEQAA